MAIEQRVLKFMPVSTKDEQRSLVMPSESWAALDKLAVDTVSVAQRGSNAGVPTWRSLFRRIADSEDCRLAIVACLGNSDAGLLMRLADAATAIAQLDEDLFHKMANNDVDVVLPQQLIQMADFLMDELRSQVAT